MDQNNEYVTPHSEDKPDVLQEQITEQEQSLTSDPNEIAHMKERQAFETYVQTSGEGIPENFKDAGAWFDSLKEAQELRIPNTTEPVTDTQESVKGVPEEEYMKWGTELATTGKLSPETRETIKSMTGFTEGMINDYEMAQHARLKNRFDEASQVVGGREQLDKMFKWATANLNDAERDAINTGLSSAQYDITLRGLAAKYNEAVTAPKAKEPTTSPQNLASVPDSQAGYIGYKTHREFKADRNNPKYQLDPKFRNAVEERMARTNWNTLPA